MTAVVQTAAVQTVAVTVIAIDWGCGDGVMLSHCYLSSSYFAFVRKAIGIADVQKGNITREILIVLKGRMRHDTL